MKAADLIKQLMAVLPTYTDAFSETVAVQSMTYADGLVTVETKNPHGLKNGEQIFVAGALSAVPIVSLTQLDGFASAVTSEPHDLTEDWPTAVSVSGAKEPGYNLSFTMEDITVPNRKNFSYKVDPATPAHATTAGQLLLYDGKDRGFNGQHAVTVINASTLTYPIAQTPYHIAGGAPVIHRGLRVGSSMTIDRFLQLYSAQKTASDAWAVIVLGDSSASVSRSVDIDLVDISAPGALYRQNLIDKFNLYIVLPAKDDLACQRARDMIEDLKGPIFHSLIGFKPPGYLSEAQQYGVVFESHGFYAYSGAYYIHEFSFQTLSELTLEDAVAPSQTVAFRDIDLSMQNSKNVTIMTTVINLDDEPLP